MFERDTLKKVPSRSQSDADWTRYKQQKKNNVNHSIKRAKKSNRRNQFRDYSGNIKHLERNERYALRMNPKPPQ